ncbi:phosphonate ABC transporter, permease protein PhnE [Hoeflea olei]|uniref:Phosphonate ABC transporter permease n=1 Tax=Hoeflea olei TaxID=1480615 RepID=A0A1C1YWA6_9HYPH|nr:phosphonate ABC transporter, permease protein PhnE [Hoeflea olei]OCW57833.1 phosphonate ABC transporter permease [Hoeflea olei]
MTTPDAATIARLEKEYPDAFRAGIWKRFAGPIGIGLCILYALYCWWFFSVGAVLGSANWKLAGAYLADWVSYEIRPDIEIKGNHLDIHYSRFSELGENPNPDWLVKDMALVEALPAESAKPGPSAQALSAPSSAGSFMAPAAAAAGNANSTRSSAGSFVAPSKSSAGNANSVQPSSSSFVAPSKATVGTAEAAPAVKDAATPALPAASEQVVRAEVDLGAWTLIVTPDRATVVHDGTRHEFVIDAHRSVTALQPLEDWAEQRSEGSTVYLDFGWAGRAEIQNDDTSPFWGKPASEVLMLMVSGERVDPSRSNIARAFNDIWYNLEWQHGDVWTKLLQTIVMAFVGTVLASLIAFPVSFLAARNIYHNRVANQLLKRFFDFLRSVDMLIWALFFTRAFGPGPLAGISAIFFTDTGTLGKLYSEALENIDDKQREGVRSVGASPAAVQRYGVLPQVLPVFVSQALYFWESNTRSATIIGAVGAGGIGLKLWEAMRTNQDWENVAYMVLLILLVVYIFDAVSSRLRGMLIGGGQA